MALVEQLTRARAEKVFKEKVSGAITHRQQLQRVLDALGGDVLLVTRLDRLARSTRDLLNTLASIGEKNAVSALWAIHGPTQPTAQGKPMLTVLAGVAEFER